jgi:predicted nuclease with TOPRIM domain
MMEALKMETPMTEWNNDRLDELNGRMKDGFAEVDKRFDKVDARFVRLEAEVKEGFERVDRRFERVSSREEVSDLRVEMRHLNQRFDRLYYLIVVTVVGLAGSLLASNIWG